MLKASLCVIMVQSDLKCEECDTMLCAADVTPDNFIANLNQYCGVDHSPPSSIVHRAVKHAMLQNKTIDPAKLLKLLYTDAR